MTFCKLLKETTLPNGDTVSAYENIDKYTSVPYYEIVVARGSIAYEVIPCAKTTWRKRFNQTAQG